MNHGGRSSADVSQWTTAVNILSELDSFAQHGEHVVVKIDSERSSSRYTVIVARGQLGTAVFHKDGDSLEELLRQALEFSHAARGGGA